MPAHGALRQLERDAQLTDGELVPVEQQEQPTPGGVGERREAVEDGAGLYHPYIRMKGWCDERDVSRGGLTGSG